MNTTNSVLNLVFFATINTHILPVVMSFDNFASTTMPTIHYQNDISNWKDNTFNFLPDYMFNTNQIKMETIIAFSKKVMDNSIDIDNEFVHIVDEEFWDLV